MMNDSQLAVLAAAIAAEPSLAPYVLSGQDNVIAAHFNAPSSFVVWRTSMSADEIIGATTWTEFIARSQGERDCYRLLTERGAVNPSDPNIRSAFQDIFSGGTGASSRAALIEAAQRLASVGEAMFATGTGTAGDPGLLVFEGAVTSDDVARALRG